MARFAHQQHREYRKSQGVRHLKGAAPAVALIRALACPEDLLQQAAVLLGMVAGLGGGGTGEEGGVEAGRKPRHPDRGQG